MKWCVYDNYGCLVRGFNSYLAALKYKVTYGNPGWTINK